MHGVYDGLKGKSFQGSMQRYLGRNGVQSLLLDTKPRPTNLLHTLDGFHKSPEGRHPARHQQKTTPYHRFGLILGPLISGSSHIPRITHHVPYTLYTIYSYIYIYINTLCTRYSKHHIRYTVPSYVPYIIHQLRAPDFGNTHMPYTTQHMPYVLCIYIYILYIYIYTLLYSTLLYYTMLCYTILSYTILYYTILYYTILYYTILYYTILYYTILYMGPLIFGSPQILPLEVRRLGYSIREVLEMKGTSALR